MHISQLGLAFALFALPNFAQAQVTPVAVSAMSATSVAGMRVLASCIANLRSTKTLRKLSHPQSPYNSSRAAQREKVFATSARPLRENRRREVKVAARDRSYACQANASCGRMRGIRFEDGAEY